MIMKRQRGERQGKTRRRAALKRGRRADLMKGATSKVEGGHAKADEAAVLARQDSKIRNGAAQRLQGFRPFADGDHGSL
jgi:hypothetical protein